jgi:hypothetical protein
VSLLHYSSDEFQRYSGGHGLLLAVPLSVVTLFCFGYVMMQPAKITTKASSSHTAQPALLTGQTLPPITSPYYLQSTPPTTLETVPTVSTQAVSAVTNQSATGSGQASAAANSAAANGQSSKQDNSAPKSDLTETLTKTLNKLLR